MAEMTITSKLLAWMTTDADEQHGAELLEQFYSTLRVIYLAARQDIGGEFPATEIDKQVRELLDDPEGSHSWRGAYEIEQLLSFIMTEGQLNAELPRRLEEAKKLELTYVSGLEALASQQSDVKTRRTIYQRLLNDLQWFYMQRIRRRAASRKLAVRVSALFLLAFFVFFLVIGIQFLAQPQISIAGSGSGSDRDNLEERIDRELPQGLDESGKVR